MSERIPTSLLNFVIIGAQKSGTTSLSHYISQHSQIEFCSDKEPDYFSKNANWQLELDAYYDLYGKSKNSKIRGEASTTYSWITEYPDTSKRLYDHNSSLKIIYLIRDPIERIRSHYQHNYLKARTKNTMSREVLSNSEYVNHSRYGLQLKPYVELFGHNNILILTQDEMKESVKNTLNKVTDFLNIDKFEYENIDLSPQYISTSRVRERRYKKYFRPLAKISPLFAYRLLNRFFISKNASLTDLDNDTKKLLWRHVSDDISYVEAEFGIELSHWRRKYTSSRTEEVI